MSNIERPPSTEYPSHFEQYIARVPEPDVMLALAQQATELAQLLAGVSEESASYRYVLDKWSVRQVVGHMIDAERILSCRAVCIARGEKAPLPGFDENEYMQHASFDSCTLNELLKEFELVRASNVLFFRHLHGDARMRIGVANANEVSVRALAYILVGHLRHHIAVLQERYLPAIQKR